jgi:hypothetical protein
VGCGKVTPAKRRVLDALSSPRSRSVHIHVLESKLCWVAGQFVLSSAAVAALGTERGCDLSSVPGIP